MRILIVHPVDDFYGASRILALVISQIHSNNEILVLTSKNNNCLGSLLDEKEIKNIQIVEMNTLPVLHSKIFTLLGFFKLFFNTLNFSQRLMFGLGKFDLMYFNTFAAIASFLPTLVLSRAKKIVHCHEIQDHRFSGRLLAKVSLLSDGVICVSDRVKKYVLNGKVEDQKNLKVQTVWNGIPIIDIPKNNKVTERLSILLVGRVTVEKGYWFVADAIKTITDKDGFELICLGDSPATSPNNLRDYNDFLVENELSDTIKTKGFVKEPFEYLVDAEIVLVPSLMADPFPTTVIEAMRAGKVVITTDNGGAREIIKHGETGFLIKALDVQGFAKILREVMNLSQTERETIGQNAKDFYLKCLTEENFKERLNEYFVSLKVDL